MTALAHHSHPTPVGSDPGASTETVSIRLFIADDHPLILESLKSVCLTFDHLAAVSLFTDIGEMEEVLESDIAPDLILIDYNMPGLGSLDAVAELLGRHPEIWFAVITGMVDSQLAQELIQRGCRGFIPKSLGANAIYHAIRLMAEGGRFLPDLPNRMPLSAPFPQPTPAVSEPTKNRPQSHRLTPRESEVMRALATGLTNKQIGKTLNIEEVTVKLHLHRGYTKLNVRNRIEAVRAIYQGALE